MGKSEKQRKVNTPKSGKASNTNSLTGFKDQRDHTKQVSQLQSLADNHTETQVQPTQKKENKTGLPDHLKSGVEQMSGHSLDDVKVHYNSDKPSQLNAHAYAQGNQIHLAPGQEKHLAHEAWHVVQQKQGRVKATTESKGVAINDDVSLEKEADVMGARALQLKNVDPEAYAAVNEAFSHYDHAILQAAFSSQPVAQLDGAGESMASKVWGFIAHVQNMSFTDAITDLISLAGYITASAGALAKNTNAAGAGAVLKLTVDLKTLTVKFGEFMQGADEHEDELKQKAAAIEAAIVVLGDIGAVIAGFVGGPAGAIIGLGITAGVAKFGTSLWKGYKINQQRNAYLPL